MAQGKDFVENKKGQLKAEVAQAGLTLRWTEATFTAIARALARKPENLDFR